VDADTDLFVQAFWVKCRDVIRPELDDAVDALRAAGHEANISTQEFSPGEKTSSESSPSLLLTIHRGASSDSRELRYRGDVPSRELEVTATGCKTARSDLSLVTQASVKNDIALCLGSLIK
jgi:hypothetical protein